MANTLGVDGQPLVWPKRLKGLLELSKGIALYFQFVLGSGTPL